MRLKACSSGRTRKSFEVKFQPRNFEMHNRQATPRDAHTDGGHDEMSRRIAGCRERLRRNRATHTIAQRCAAPDSDGRATGEDTGFESPARRAHGKESERED